MDDLDEALKTHIKRLEIVNKKLEENLEDMKERQSLELCDYLYRINLMEQAYESLFSITDDFKLALTESKRKENLISSALRLYANTYGRELVTERDLPDGIPIQFDVSVLPIDNEEVKVSVDWRIKKDDN